MSSCEESNLPRLPLPLAAPRKAAAALNAATAAADVSNLPPPDSILAPPLEAFSLANANAVAAGDDGSNLEKSSGRGACPPAAAASSPMPGNVTLFNLRICRIFS
uniref:Uncharacterized protein n=1 Tax=Cacopsylla melanoneura TaxID=428564 RepID=A0A8D8SPE0_9HEMI